MSSIPFYYITVSWKRTEPVFDRFTPFTVLAALEANFVARRCWAEVLHFIDGSTVYRVQAKYMDKFKSDFQGYYMDLMTFGVYRFTETDPVIASKPTTSGWEWLPV